MTKLLKTAFLTGLVLSSAGASAEKWIQYDVWGKGQYYTIDYDAEDPTRVYKQISMHATIFAEVDPSADGDVYFSDGKSFSQDIGSGYIPEDNVSAEAKGNALILSYDYQQDFDNCSHGGCESWDLKSLFAPGSFDALGDKIPSLISGSFDVLSTSHYFEEGANGMITSVQSRVVSGPRSPTISYGAIPEPSSWAMMLGGFGVIGGALRSQRKTAVRFG